MQLTPGIWLFSRTVLGGLVAITCLAYLWQGYYEEHWWSVDYGYGLAIPIAIVALFMWFAFVPKKCQILDDRFVIQFHFGPRREVNWDRLKYWGNTGHATFCLQFSEPPTLQIALFAFPKSQRQQFVDFLTSRFPERKAKAWIGTRGYRW